MDIKYLSEKDKDRFKSELLCMMAKIGVAAVLQLIAEVSNDCADGHPLLPVDPKMLEISALIDSTSEQVEAIAQ
jgi:hypothetical protein